MFSIKGKVILITGGSGVLGKAMVKALVSVEADVVVLGRNKAKLDKISIDFANEGIKIHTLSADVTNKESLKKAYSEFTKKFDHLDVLINAAGGNKAGATIMPDQTILDLSEEDLRNVIDLNYLGTVLPTQVFLPSMIGQKKGNIINVSSMAAQRPLTRVMGYASSKAAIDNYTKWLAVELAGKYGDKFRVNAIAPGFFLTQQNKELLNNKDGSLTERGSTIINQTPFRRFGNPEEIVGTVIWLCSDASKFITGTIISIDGGFNAFSGV